jgi:acetyltransferase-like isoleucine patch superfamily enzyme
MKREKIFENRGEKKLFDEINDLHLLLSEEFKKQFNRSLPFSDEIFDRWERSKRLGFGEGTSIYDSSYVIGDVKIGKNCWIGMFTILDGSGGLIIGDNCTISAGVHIYSHDNLKKTLSWGKLQIEHESVKIGNCTYVAPQSIITKGVSIGNHCVVASNSFVNKSFDDFSIIAGNPAKKIGTVNISGDTINFIYDNK